MRQKSLILDGRPRRVSETLIPNLHLWKNVQYHNLGIERQGVDFIKLGLPSEKMLTQSVWQNLLFNLTNKNLSLIFGIC